MMDRFTCYEQSSPAIFRLRIQLGINRPMNDGECFEVWSGERNVGGGATYPKY